MSEKYAPEAPVKDKRVQEFAYNATEMQSVDADVRRTATEYNSVQADLARKEGSKTVELMDKDAKLEKPSEDELKKIEDASRTVKDDVTKSDDIRAAAEIMEKIAKRQREVQAKLRKGEKVKYARSSNMFNAITLYLKPAPGSKAEAKLERFSAKREELNEYLSTRFSGGTISFTDKLLSASDTADKDLTAPVEKSKKYSDL